MCRCFMLKDLFSGQENNFALKNLMWQKTENINMKVFVIIIWFMINEKHSVSSVSADDMILVDLRQVSDPQSILSNTGSH